MTIPNQPIFEISLIVHNLEMNPSDLPSSTISVFNENGDKVYYAGSTDDWRADDVENNYPIVDPPKLWYDIPEFDIERTKLEKLSKEELIDMILSKEK